MDGKMRHGRYIYLLGDVHSSFYGLNSFINKRIRLDRTLRTIAPYWKRDGDDFQIIILQCGDFAYFWPMGERPVIQNRIDWLPAGHVPFYWTGGHHEDWDELDRLGSGISELVQGVFYCPFGSTLTLSPDVTVLFAGGAESADKDWRIEEMKRGAPKIWWEQEGISDADLSRLALVPKADWIVSHTAPNAFDVENEIGRSEWISGVSVPSRLKLEQVLLKYEPKRWFFGHYHHFMNGFTDGCEWECLPNLDGAERSWNKIWIEWVD